MVNAMRASLARSFQGERANGAVEHAGVLLDYYLREIGSGAKPHLTTLYEQACRTRSPLLYRRAFERWQGLHAQDRDHTATREFQIEDRLLVGAGGDNVRETAITLHHSYGVPIIPGSALKGLARAYARWWLEDDAEFQSGDYVELMKVIFGEQDLAGYVTWHDAWYIPASAPDDRPLALDVLTPHHKGYYTGGSGERAWPSDFDDPTPVQFLSARGSYLVAISGPTREWADRAMALLTYAAAEWGVGGKTSSGYGRMSATVDEGGRAGQGERTVVVTDHPSIVQIRSLRPQDIKGQITNLYQQAIREEEPLRKQSLIAIWEKIESYPDTHARKWQRSKAWIQNLKDELGIEENDD